MQKPQFTIVDFVSGKFIDELEQYLTDQVPLRDDWVTLKIYLELAVGKRESGGVYIGRDKYLMDKFTSYSKKQLAANAAALAELQKKLAAEDISMDTILVPVAAQVLTDKLPAYAPVADYAAILDRMAEVLGDDRARQFHVHFSRIEYSAGGEKRHWTFADTQFGPEPQPLMELLAERQLTPVVICESAGTQAEDAQTMQQMYRAARNV